jgi:hypothetical protein
MPKPITVERRAANDQSALALVFKEAREWRAGAGCSQWTALRYHGQGKCSLDGIPQPSGLKAG